jgi:hypothetical protein
LALAFTPAPPPAAPGDAGYWLSADLLGPASARARAVEQLRSTPEAETLPPVPPGLTGVAVAHVPDIRTALRWVERSAFGAPAPDGAIDPPQLRLVPAPLPGDPLHTELGVQLRALAVSGQTPLGERRPVDWPSDPATILPPDSAWVIADLVPNAAPIFAAPAPAIPPASERFATIHRSGQLFVVRTVDRCHGDGEQRQCLRWAQVVARDEDRFVPGYVPAFQVAARSDWEHGEGALPRAILLRSGVEGSRARFVLLARTRDDTLHRATVTAAMDGDAFPDASLTVDTADGATVIAGNEPSQRFALDATLDARATPRPAGDAEDPPPADARAPARSEAR